MENNTNNELLNPAIILLKEYLELLDLHPKQDQWKELSEKSNPPRYYRYQRIKILFSGFRFEFRTNSNSRRE